MGQIWIWIIASLVCGIAVGFLVSKLYLNRSFAGTLREDRSDPTEPPYLFLELEPRGMEKIHKYKTVTFKVNLKNYI